MVLEGPYVTRCRGIERDPGPGIAHLGDERLGRAGRGDERLHAHPETVQGAARPGRALPDGGQHHRPDVGGRAYRVRPDSVGHLPGHRAQPGVDGGELNRDAGVLDRPGVEQRNHQVQAVVLALEVQPGPVLPAVPYRADRLGVLAYPGCRRVPGDAVAALDVTADLSAESQGEPPARELLQGPGGQGHHRGAPREGNGHRGSQPQLRGGLGGQRQQRERVVLGLLDDQAAVPDFLQQRGVAGDGPDIQGDIGCPQPGIDLAKGEQSLQPHGFSLCIGRLPVSGASRRDRYASGLPSSMASFLMLSRSGPSTASTGIVIPART